MSARRQHPGCNNAGHTLVELLVAITVLGLLLSVTFGAVRAATQNLVASVEHAHDAEQLRASAGFLRRQLGQLVASTWNEGGEDKVTFSASRDAMTFLAPAPQSLLGAGLVTATVEFRDTGNSLELWFGIADYDPGGVDWNAHRPATRTLLVGDLSDASMQFFGAMTEDDDRQWHDGWADDADSYPDAVRLYLAPASDRQPPVELVLPIFAERRP